MYTYCRVKDLDYDIIVHLQHIIATDYDIKYMFIFIDRIVGLVGC